MTDLECKYGKFFSVIWEDVKYYEGKISIGESRSWAHLFKNPEEMLEIDELLSASQ